ncbi:glycoside hydrolase family 3 N-terminal domain-containing protein [Caulobacter segnis]
MPGLVQACREGRQKGRQVRSTRIRPSRSTPASRTCWSRMTPEEKAAQLVGIWLTKNKIQTPEGEFSPEAGHARISPTAWARSRVRPTAKGRQARHGDRRRPAPTTARSNATPRKPRATPTPPKSGPSKDPPGHSAADARRGPARLCRRDATSFPQAIALASTFDTELTEKIFAVAARARCAPAARTWPLAPVVAARDPRWGRIEETYGEDPHVCAEIGLAAIRGFPGATLPLAKDKVFVTPST